MSVRAFVTHLMRDIIHMCDMTQPSAPTGVYRVSESSLESTAWYRTCKSSDPVRLHRQVYIGCPKFLLTLPHGTIFVKSHTLNTCIRARTCADRRSFSARSFSCNNVLP